MSLLRIVGVCVAAALAVGCAPKPPKPVEAKALVTVSDAVNPDSTGRPSPVVLRVFQLKGEAEFNEADFFALYEREKETLGQSLILREEFIFKPGEQRELVLPLSPEARHIGAVAAFRDIRSTKWRAITAAPEKSLMDMLSKDRVTITVEPAAVTVAIKD